MPYTLEFEDVRFNYAEGGTISGVSFALSGGDFVALMGENGAGKSTLCRLCNGLLKPSSGHVKVCGQDTASVRISALARHVGFLFQNPDRQICKNTVAEEISLGLEFTVSDKTEREDRLRAALEMFGLDGSSEPFGLSRGERQKVALASILAPRPEILILDEPTTGLDAEESEIVMEAVAKLNRAGTTVLMVSHDMELVAAYAKSAMVLHAGRLIGNGSVREIMRDNRIMETASLLPAQIPLLAARLAGLGQDFYEAFTVEEMARAVAGARGAEMEAAS